MYKPIGKIKEVIKNNQESEVNITDMFKPNTEWASEELASERYGICQSCPEITKLTNQCKKCGCFMAAKVRLEKATCPLAKW
jgi:hypothetical protein